MGLRAATITSRREFGQPVTRGSLSRRTRALFFCARRELSIRCIVSGRQARGKRPVTASCRGATGSPRQALPPINRRPNFCYSGEIGPPRQTPGGRRSILPRAEADRVKRPFVPFPGPAGDDPTSPGDQAGQAASRTSLSLLDRVRTDDEAAWQRLIKLYGPLIYSWCRGQSLQQADAADVVQEVFSSLAGNIKRFRSDRPGDSFRKWLKTITNNKIRDYWRREGHRPQAVGGTDAQRRVAALPENFEMTETSAAESTDESEVRFLLRQALELVRSEVAPQTWQAFWETVVEGREAAEVAAQLGLSPTTVRVAKSRVRSRLRQEFGELLD